MIYKSDISLKKCFLEKENNSYKFKEELLDLYLYFLRKDRGSNDFELWRYFSEYFKNKRTKHAISNEDLIFIERLNLVVLEGNSNNNDFLQSNVSGGEWLIGRHEYNGRIDSRIYRFIWSNLKLALSENKAYILIKFWMIIYDYIDRIPTVLPEHNNGEIINQETIDASIEEKQDLIDFATALGGMLYYKNHLQEISTIFYYTQSQPPVYKAILPGTIRDCLKLYSGFFGGLPVRYSLLDITYPFSSSEGNPSEEQILGNILRFIILEYLRLFTTLSIYYGFEPLEYRGLEEGHIRNFLSFKDFFKERLIEFVADKDLCYRIFGHRTFSHDPIVYFDNIVAHYQST